MRFLLIIALLLSFRASAQDKNIAQFVIWEPKEGMEQAFEKGYQQHLQWHAANSDLWDWYGWYFISGPRDGQLLDATVDRAWADFDQRLKPAEDAADNQLHVHPFAKLKNIIKMEKIASCGHNKGLQTHFLRMITITAYPLTNAIKALDNVTKQLHAGCFYTYKIVDGGNLHQLVLLLGYDSFSELGKDAEITELLEKQAGFTLKGIESEILSFKKEMSRLHQ